MPRNDGKEGPATQRLQRLGLDVRFLSWLEGKEDRLPRLDACRKVKPEEYASAIRAASWLTSLFGHPEAIAPCSPDDWLARYKLLEAFLWYALRWSGTYTMSVINRDIEELDKVLETLLPKSSWELYRKDVLNLRKKGEPSWFPELTTRRRRSGGTAESCSSP